MITTDRRLLGMLGMPEATVNLNRMLAIIDNIAAHEFAVDDESKLVAAIADATKILSYITAGITLTGQLTMAQAFELNGQDFALTDATLDANQYMALQISHEGVSIREVQFAISGNSDGNTIYSIDVYAAGSLIEGCTFVMSNAGSSGSVSVYYEGYAGHKLNDNTLSNGVAFTGGCVMDEVKNNTFAATKGFGLGECTIGGIHYFEADADKVAAIKAYLIAEGNVTTDDATGLVVEGYFEP